MEADKWFKVNLGMHIRKKRNELNLTKEDVSFRTGIDNKHIGKIERGAKLPSSLTLGKLVIALNLDIIPLFTEFERKFFDNDNKTFKL